MAVEVKMPNIVDILTQLTDTCGAIVSRACCSEDEIKVAIGDGRYYHTEDGFGYVLRTKEWREKAEFAINEQNFRLVLNMSMGNSLEKSVNHIGFAGEFEYYFEGAGHLYKAHINRPVMIDGRRCGRWECGPNQADLRLKMVGLKRLSEG